MLWFFGLEDDVAAGLMDPRILPVTAKSLGKALARHIPRQFHATDNTRPGQGGDELAEAGAGQRKMPQLPQLRSCVTRPKCRPA